MLNDASMPLRHKRWTEISETMNVGTRAPNGSGRPAGNSGLTLTLRVRIGGAGGADPTRPDPTDPRVTRNILLIYYLFIYSTKIENYIIILR